MVEYRCQVNRKRFMKFNHLCQCDAAKGYSDTRKFVHTVCVCKAVLAFVNVVSPTSVRTQI